MSPKETQQPDVHADPAEDFSPACEPSKEAAHTTEKGDKPLRFAEKVESLEKALTEAQEKADANWEKALRAVAELENMKRRAERDVENAHKYALERFAQALLPVIDSLEKALEVKKGQAESEVNALYQGVQMTLKLFMDTIGKFGLDVLDPIGESFDPHVHEAMAAVEDPKAAANTVLTVYQKGYRLNGRVVRPARVVVSK